MKSLFTFFLIVTVFSVSAQDGVIVKYYDSLWHPTKKEFASFYTRFLKEDTLYRCTSYYFPSMNIYSKGTYTDTFFSKNIGAKFFYYENGVTKDSSLSSIKGQPIYKYTFFESKKLQAKTIYGTDRNDFETNVYYENGKQHVHSFWDKWKKIRVDEGYDSIGNLIPNYIYEKEAEFPGGAIAWMRYLQRNLNSSIPSENGAPPGKYEVNISFLVDKEGNVSDVFALNDSKYGTKEEAIRVILKGPTWIPATQLNKPVAYRARQSITFVVSKQ